MPGVSGGGKQRAKVTIDAALAFPWLLKQARAEGAATRKAATDMNPRDRLATEQADRVSIENALRRGELCVKADVRSIVIGATLSHRSERNGIAGRLASELVGLAPAEIRGRILDELRRCDEQFSQRVGAFAVPDEPDDGDTGGEEAAEETEPSNVGGRKPRLS